MLPTAVNARLRACVSIDLVGGGYQITSGLFESRLDPIFQEQANGVFAPERPQLVNELAREPEEARLIGGWEGDGMLTRANLRFVCYREPRAEKRIGRLKLIATGRSMPR
jgi:hypothetical protein